MAGDWIDFKAVKAAVSMEMVLAHYGLELRRAGADSLRGPCPLPTHAKKRGRSTDRSFGVSTAKNAWACQSASCVTARSGRRGGNVLDFVSWMESCSTREAALKLDAWFGNGTGGTAPKRETAPQGAPTPQGAAAEETGTTPIVDSTTPLTFVLKLEAEHAYLRERKLSPESVAHFGIGYANRGLMKQRIAIPIHDGAGALVAYAGRWVGEGEPPEGEGKYKLPAGFRKGQIVFNLHRVPPEARTAIVVEGFFSVFWLHQCGFRNVVALMGCTITDRQRELLAARFKGVQLLLDGDAAGRGASDTIASALAHSLWVKALSCPDGRQPDELAPAELKTLLEVGRA
jgi:DNA primase